MLNSCTDKFDHGCSSDSSPSAQPVIRMFTQACSNNPVAIGKTRPNSHDRDEMLISLFRYAASEGTMRVLFLAGLAGGL